MATQKPDLTVRSTLLRSEKPNKGLEAIAAPNPNQMNRLIGYLPDGKKVMVAQRPGKGGMDFNKLLGGKVFAVAADGMSPVYEKDKEGNPTKTQKTEDGLPLYSSSGFYLMSSREYPALAMGEYYTLLRDKGAQVVLIHPDAVTQATHVTLESELDLEMLVSTVEAELSDDKNFVAQFDDAINKKRQRIIERAKQDAEEAGDKFEGVEFKSLSVSPKDGNPALVLFWSVEGGKPGASLVTREHATLDDSDRPIVLPVDAQKAAELFSESKAYQAISAALSSGTGVQLHMVAAHIMRTSVSFKKKVENTLAMPADRPVYGDAVYVKGALKSWCRGLVSVMHSQHPNFPTADYDAHHYVVALRQAEIAMTKKADGNGWLPPQIAPVELYELVSSKATVTA